MKDEERRIGRRWIFAVVLLCACVTEKASATVVYSSMGNTGAAWDSTKWFDVHSYIAGFPPGGSVQRAAMPFTVPAGASYALQSVEMLLGSSGPGTNPSLTIQLASDQNGLPGQPIADLVPPFVPVPSTGVIGTAVPAVPATLAAGTRYWIVAGPGLVSSSSVRWYFANGGLFGIYAQSALNDGGGWSLFENALGHSAGHAAFRVNGVAVPEPSVALMLVSGLLALTKLRRRD